MVGLTKLGSALALTRTPFSQGRTKGRGAGDEAGDEVGMGVVGADAAGVVAAFAYCMDVVGEGAVGLAVFAGPPFAAAI